MKLKLITALSVLLSSSAFAAKELNLYFWSQYMDPEIIVAFEKKFDCKVIQSYFESLEEMTAKLQAGGASQYDVVLTSGFTAPAMIKLGLIQKLDHKKIPNIKNLTPLFTSPGFDEGNQYTAAYQWGTVGMVYNKDKFTTPPTSWDTIFKSSDTSYSLLNSEREMIGVALRYLGYSMNTTNKQELKTVADFLIKAKNNKNCMGFDANIAGLNKVIAKTLDASMCYSGDAFMNMDANPGIGYIIPKEGTVVWSDNMAIPAKAPHADLAHAFINFILDPAIGAQLSNYNMYATPNEASLPMIEKTQLANPAIYPDAETMLKLESILDVGSAGKVYGEVWKMIKTR